MAVYLAQLGRSVLIVDSDPSGASLHTTLDVSLAEPRFEEGETDVDEFVPVDTKIPGLRLLPQIYGYNQTAPLRPGRKPRWASKLRQQDVDYVIVDVGQGTHPTTLDLFLGADLGILTCAPDPASIEGTYRFASALFLRRMQRTLLTDRFRLRMLERALLSLPPLPQPLQVVRALMRFETGLAELAISELGRIRPRLVMNGTRGRADAELGYAMQDMSERYLGVHLDYAGHVERDDTVWLSSVRRRPLLIDNPNSKSARNIERIARRVLALVARRNDPAQATPPRPRISEEPTLYDILLTHRGATDEDLSRAYKRQREIYTEGSLPLVSLVKPQGLAKAQAQIDEAHDTLLDPLRRRAYDLSTFPNETVAPAAPGAQLDAAQQAEREATREELAAEINPQTIFTGPLLRKVREAHGIELKDITTRTKISSHHLAAIEEERFADLPPFVYLRGFVTEFAKYLKLDVTQVTRSYLRRYRDWKNEHEHGEAR
jgi:flagellar biosynthesis protein FlhG